MKVMCLCGKNIMNDICDPSDDNGWFVSDNNLFTIASDLWDDILDIAVCMWECHACGRIAFGNGYSNLKWYMPVNGKNGNLTITSKKGAGNGLVKI